ncbi:MAG TPA: Rieske 2Fe-2S domain-containing protein [Vicinamibacteria bacterium]|nr:Rieske 2Fe-2S domain-containing protein [Vicinamibacteria bacterium]
MSENERDPAGSRREFFMTGVAAVGLASAGFVASTFRYLVPTVLYEPPARFTIGDPGRFPPGSVTFLEDRRLFLFNGAEGFYTVSSVCTHLGCNVKRAASGFECPCHGSRFDENGRVVQGPAPSALAWYALSLSPRGELIVDLERQVGPDFRLKA